MKMAKKRGKRKTETPVKGGVGKIQKLESPGQQVNMTTRSMATEQGKQIQFSVVR